MHLITEALLRKRSEHNEGILPTLEEVALHQQDLGPEVGPELSRCCRHLKILYLQNNLLSKTTGLSKLKELEYLNLAVNNIQRIESLQGCESLVKLDLTVNFIDELMSVALLAANERLEELYLTGNPVAKRGYYREFVVASVPQLVRLDGEEVTKSERIAAMQRIDELRARAAEDDEAARVRAASAEATVRFDDQGNPVYGHNPQDRVRMHEELVAKKQAGETKEVKPQKPRPSAKVPDLDKTGRPLNRNESKMPFLLKHTDDGKWVVLDLTVGKYLDNSLIDVDIQPTFVRVVAKDKVFQFVLPDEVHPDQSRAERTPLGKLVLTCRLVREVLAPEYVDPAEMEKKKKEQERAERERKREQARKERDPYREEESLLDDNLGKGVQNIDIRGIVQDKQKPKADEEKRFTVGQVREPEPSPSFVDDPDVPPLE
jgi:protein TilB